MIIINSRKRSHLMLPAIAVMFFIFAIADPKGTSEYTEKALKICIEQVIPSLYFFLVLSGIITRSGIALRLPGIICYPLEKFLGISRASVAAVILGMFCGFPTGGKIAADLYKTGQIDKDEAERLITFSNNTGTAFAIAGIGGAVLNNVNLGVVIYFTQITVSLIIGFFTGRKKQRKKSSVTSTGQNVQGTHILTASIYDSSQSILAICGFIMFFYVMINIINSFIPFTLVKAIIATVSEVSSGANTSVILGQEAISAAFAAFAVGWSGLSVHMQLSFFLHGTDISMKKYYISKLVSGILCGVTVFIIVSQVDTLSPDLSYQTITYIKNLYFGYYVLIFSFFVFLLSFASRKLEKNRSI